MKAVTSLIIGGIVSSLTAYNILQSTSKWAPKIIDRCFHSDKLRVVYTGISSMLDRVLCFYVHFNQQALHDIVGLPLTQLLMAAFGTSFAIMAFEGSRKELKRSTLLVGFPLLGLLANLVGISVVFPAIWIPLYLYSVENKVFKADDFFVSMPRVYGILAGLVVGYGIPSAIISSPLVTKNSSIEQDLLCIWQVLPVLIVPLFGMMEKGFKKMGSVTDTIEDAEMKTRLTLVEGKDALERSFLFLGLLNMVIYGITYVATVHQGIHIWDSILLLLNAPSNLPVGLTFQELGQLLCARTALVEYISLSISFALWAMFNSGIIAGLLVFIATPIIGPAAAISFYSYYRETRIDHNTTSLEKKRK
ncbi:hypothetical protein BD770DRAFT_421764 [Pilaira anomala]|nr:hypothetical protein BD770DRAFT_421764 [Pilaira anomala]